MARIRCNYCQNEIYGYRLRCAECEEFDLCLQCFSLGAEVAAHRREHSFIIKNDQGPCIFEDTETWSLAEENMLLDAVEQYGFGNWNGAAAHLETRTASQCEDHYRRFYVNGVIGDSTLQEVPRPSITDHSNANGALAGPLSPSLTIPITPLEIGQQQQQELGYMPYRDDFEREHDNEAEALVSSLALNHDDEEIDTAIKLAQISKYRLRLQERDRRKRIAREYGLISAGAPPISKVLKTPHTKKKSGKTGRELQERLKPFSQFHSMAEHHMLFDNIKREKETKARIKELIRLRKNGITKLEDEEIYEEEKFKREKRKENKKKMVSALFAAQLLRPRNRIVCCAKAEFPSLQKSRRKVRKNGYFFRRKRRKNCRKR
ncbi:transcriptional adapter 2-beta isoform X2 [Aplysia californica]|uniref:Transcriptional adapter 2-beta isoform X2 n=1 Tax=Aplysia californica TaxID=6500 RepID=A0ABM1A4R1_APLCA|nr:transcriptional adapter 2-beta isoform X2 [Aplysia californica]